MPCSPKYLNKQITSAADVPEPAILHSASHGDLVILKQGSHLVNEPSQWVVHACGIDCPLLLTVTFKCKLKTFLFTQAYDLSFHFIFFIMYVVSRCSTL